MKGHLGLPVCSFLFKLPSGGLFFLSGLILLTTSNTEYGQDLVP